MASNSKCFNIKNSSHTIQTRCMMRCMMHIIITNQISINLPKVYNNRYQFDEIRVRACKMMMHKRGGGALMGKPLKFPGVSDEVHRLLNADMDLVDARRRARDAFKDVQLSVDHCLFKGPRDVIETELIEKNSKGVEIFSKSWVPKNGPPKAVVYFCHGYGDTCTFFFEGIARKLALCGYGVFAMDYPGFGLSEGLHGYIPNFNKLVNDVIEHFSKVKEKEEYSKLPSFLFGQSMGGAIALNIHLKQPDDWTGAILVAPVCKIAVAMVPPLLVTQLLTGVAKFLPKSKLVPQRNMADMAFRDMKNRDLTAYNVIAYKDKPRLGTAVELLRATQVLERDLAKVSLPMLILHGKADTVADSSVSTMLYEKASSTDKILKLYDYAYHSLLEGEPDEVILRVFADIVSWLDEHSQNRS